MQIRVLDQTTAQTARAALADLLVDSVEHGASVNFVQPMTSAKAELWWDGALASQARDERIILVAENEGAILGTVQLILAAPENQSFRADVGKLLVHSSARGRGLGTALMSAVEVEARRVGRTLLVLDTESGSDAERVYQRLGWTKLGEIPGYAETADGSRRANCSFFYKELR